MVVCATAGPAPYAGSGMTGKSPGSPGGSKMLKYLHLLYTGARGDGTSTDDSYWLWLDHRPIILPLLHHIGGHYPLEANPIRSD